MVSEIFNSLKNRLKGLNRLEGGDAWEIGKIQIEYLIKEGLKPEHYLLDIPCGSFRAGRFIIDYLKEDHYFGIDGSKENIENGRKYILKPLGLMAKNPALNVVKLSTDPVDFNKLLGRRFDYVWIHALFDHIPHDVIRRSLMDLCNVTESGGRIYATIFLNPHGEGFLEPMFRPWNGSLKKAVVTYPDREYWHHTLDFFKEVLKDIPELSLNACLYDYPHPLGLRMLKFVRK